MKIVFMGTSSFAIPVLSMLVERDYNVIAVYTQPPRPAGRGKKTYIGPLGQYGIDNNIPTLHPENFSQTADLDKFKNLNADLVIVVSYGLILPSKLLKLAKIGFFNVHASLLPRWRGAAPIQRALLAGDRETGICVIKLETSLDTGPIVFREVLKISETDSALKLHDKLSDIGANLTIKLCNHASSIKYEDQAKEGITYAKKINKSETRIDWSMDAQEINLQIRAFSPKPGAWFEINGERIKILESAVGTTQERAGFVIGQYLEIACKFGSIHPKILQRAGKSPMLVDDFLRGYPISEGVILV